MLAFDTATVKPKSSASVLRGLRDAPDAGDTHIAGDAGLVRVFVVEPVIHDSHDDPGLLGVAGPLSDTVEDEPFEQDEPGRSCSSMTTVLKAEGNIEECVLAGTS